MLPPKKLIHLTHLLHPSSPETKQIESEGIRSVVDSYLSVGDSVFSTISGMAVGSQWFGRKL
jgi:hypothetical protein